MARPATSKGAFMQLDRICKDRGWYLELVAGRKLLGEGGRQWRDLERIDVVPREGGGLIMSMLVSGDVDHAASRIVAALSEKS